MITFAYDIIRRMQEIARRLWTAFFSAFIAIILGMIQVIVFVKGSWLIPLLVILVVAGFLCFSVAIWAFVYDLKHTWEKEHPEKMRERAEEKALRERYPTMFKKKHS